MSDNYITICTEKEVENPKELSVELINWLQEKEYIEKEKSNCILSLKGLGYKPGRNHVDAIGVDENITRYITCGLEIKTQREVFDAMSFTAFNNMNCPKCKLNRFEGITPKDFYTDNCTVEQMERYSSVFKEFEKWKNHKATKLNCHHCGENSELEEYEIEGNICLSNLGFTFWNWPQIKTEVIREIKKILNTEIKVIQGHL
jgi:hypothetical protein